MSHFTNSWQNLFQNDGLLKPYKLKKYMALQISAFKTDLRMRSECEGHWKEMNPFYLCEPNAFQHLGRTSVTPCMFVSSANYIEI